MYYKCIREILITKVTRTHSDVETASHAGHCPINLVNEWIYGEQDNGVENRPKCLAVSSLFPHPCIHNIIFIDTCILGSMYM